MEQEIIFFNCDTQKIHRATVDLAIDSLMIIMLTLKISLTPRRETFDKGNKEI